MSKILENVHILIAEDNETNRLVVARMIEMLGGTYDMANDGVEAIRYFNPRKHDLALLDIEMPLKSGIEVINFIRQRPDVPHDFPIIALTAFALKSHRAKIRDAGANAIVAKPILNVEAFGNELASFLPNRSNNEEEEDFSSFALLKLESSMGQSAMPELLYSLEKDLDEIASKLVRLSEAPALDELREVAHSLHSLAKMAGDDALAREARRVEALDEGDRISTLKGQTLTLYEHIFILKRNIQDFALRYQAS